MGAAKDNLTCTSLSFNQLVNVGTLAIKIAVLGAKGEAEALANNTELGSDLVSQLKDKFNEIKAIYDKHEDLFNFLRKAARVRSTAAIAIDVLNALEFGKPTPTEIIRCTA